MTEENYNYQTEHRGPPPVSCDKKQEWQSLTDEEIDEEARRMGLTPVYAPEWFKEVVETVAAMLKAKNK